MPPKPLKPPQKRVESGATKINFPHSNFYILAIGTSHGPPQPQMVGFRDLVGTDFAPVSNKTAVNAGLGI